MVVAPCLCGCFRLGSLICAARHTYALVCLLLQHGRSALHVACMAGRAAAVAALLSRGAALEAPDKEGYTPLILASRYGKRDVCSLLIKAGANLKATDHASHTAADVARHGGFRDTADFLVDAELDA